MYFGMREIIETIRREMKRLAAEGQESVVFNDESMSILRKLASGDAPEAVMTVVAELVAEEIEKLPDVPEIEFATQEDFNMPKEKQSKAAAPKLVRNDSEDFHIAPIPAPKDFVIPEGSKEDRWNFLRNLVLADPVCREHVKPGKKVVFGVGSLEAKVFFCGEAPGADEEIQGEPFVGKAGQLLTKIIAAMGFKREDVYIGNIMNWRPELPTSRGNRPPTEQEMNYCLPYLKAQIEIVNPQIIVALGGTAVNGLLGFDPSRRLGKIRGVWQTFEGRDLMITYHPSYLLQYASPAVKRQVWEDMMAVMERLGMTISEKQKGYFL